MKTLIVIGILLSPFILLLGIAALLGCRSDYRILEKREKYWPQTRSGFFGWKFLTQAAGVDSDRYHPLFTTTKDYADAVKFDTMEEAENFLKKYERNVKVWQNEINAKRRRIERGL